MAPGESWIHLRKLIQIDYPGVNNYSQFSYDGLWRNTKIVETASGSVTSTKQLIHCGRLTCEERDGTGALIKQFFDQGEKLSAAIYFFCRDHLSSVRELTDTSGAIKAAYSFDAYGRREVHTELIAADFQYAGYYYHSASGLNGTDTRAYNASIGRFISRDSIYEFGGVNMYSYAFNAPTNWTDPEGTFPGGSNSGGGSGGSNSGGGSGGTNSGGGSFGSNSKGSPAPGWAFPGDPPRWCKPNNPPHWDPPPSPPGSGYGPIANAGGTGGAGGGKPNSNPNPQSTEELDKRYDELMKKLRGLLIKNDPSTIPWVVDTTIADRRYEMREIQRSIINASMVPIH